MPNGFRTCFAVISSLIGLLCLGYALVLSQVEPTPGRRSESAMVVGMMTFGLSGGLCILAGAVAINGPQGPQAPQGPQSREPATRT
jgi:hypothetical protein